jgi:hypothetical protein
MSIDVPEPDEPVDGPVHRYTFPPFPQMLPGRELPPFAQFVSKGIRKRTAPDAVEVDGLGIPTVRLRVDETGKPKKKKKKSKVLAVRDAEGRQLPWWEVWDKDEDQRGPDAPYARFASSLLSPSGSDRGLVQVDGRHRVPHPGVRRLLVEPDLAC